MIKDVLSSPTGATTRSLFFNICTNVRRETHEMYPNIKYSGITSDPQLTFHDHMTVIAKASYQRLRFIMKHSRQCSNPLSSRLLLNALVRSHLAYNALTWNPHVNKYIHTYILMIENENKVFLRSHSGKKYGYCPHMYRTERLLDMLGYKSLGPRGNLSLLRFVFQLMRGSISCPALL
jgi:hypothetical protein